MKTFLSIVLGVIALAVLWNVLGWLLRLTFGIVGLAMHLLWLALLVAAVIFVIGLVRRMLIRS
ncbi:MAG TPA: hypothetical protein VFU47_08340 [Armatimonadota bacterium]|nr:hypothetical protein [Armatimonadota bacterium]